MSFSRSWQSHIVWLPFLIVALPSAAHAEPRRPTHIACVGDSITYGYLGSPGKDYPSVLQGLVGSEVKVGNFGHNGATMLKTGNDPYWTRPAFTNATKFVEEAGDDAVASVVILLGANDSKPVNWNADAFIEDYEAMVDHFAGLSTQPTIYLGLPAATGNNPCCNIRGDVIKNEQLSLIRSLAARKGLPLIDLYTPTAGHPEYFSDGVHPTDEGYALLAELVLAGLNREPSVSITSPQNGAMQSPPVLLRALASGDTVPIAKVEFFNGEVLLGSVETEPFALEWPAPPGRYTLTAKATDITQASAESEPVELVVSLYPPSTGAGGHGGSGGSSGAPSPSGGTGGAGGSGGTSTDTPPSGGAPSGSGARPGETGDAGSSEEPPAPPSGSNQASGGCACQVGTGRSSRPSALAFGVGALIWAHRRRKLARRAG